MSEENYLPESRLKQILEDKGFESIDTLSPGFDKEVIEDLMKKVKPDDKIVILKRDGGLRFMTFTAYRGEGEFQSLYCTGRDEDGPNKGMEFCIGSDEFTNRISYGWKVINKLPW